MEMGVASEGFVVWLMSDFGDYSKEAAWKLY
jgi:hypothetical protein